MIDLRMINNASNTEDSFRFGSVFMRNTVIIHKMCFLGVRILRIQGTFMKKIHFSCVYQNVVISENNIICWTRDILICNCDINYTALCSEITAFFLVRKIHFNIITCHKALRKKMIIIYIYIFLKLCFIKINAVMLLIYYQ